MRDLVILARRSDRADEAPPTPEGVAACVDPGYDGSSTVLPVLDLPHADMQARFLFGRRSPIAIDGLAWLATGDALPAAWAGLYRESFRLTVRAELGWRPPTDELGDPLDVVKQVSFLHAADGYGEDVFRPHYRHHVEIARRHMPALWQYVQNDVVATGGEASEAVGVVAVSELWFRTTDDFLNRYFPSVEDQQQFSSHEGFLDLSKASSFVCSSHRIATPEGDA
jgi:hypothetical protein